MSVDSAGMAARLGIKPGMVVQELGWDEDADEDLRDAVIEASGGEMVDEDTDDPDRAAHDPGAGQPRQDPAGAA